MIRNLMLVVACSFYLSLSAKILIFTYSYNRPDFIEIQHKTFQKFLDDNYEFVVFNDASDQHLLNHINNMCTRLGIKCIRIPQEIHNRPYLQRWPGEDYNHPTVRNCNVVQYSLNTLGFDHDDIVLLIDSDMFLVKKFNIREFLNGYDIGGRLLGISSRRAVGDIIYLWQGLTFLDMRTLPNRHALNFNCGKVENRSIDAGGNSYYYLKNNPTIKITAINYNFADELQCDNCKQMQNPTCMHNKDSLMAAGLDEHQIQLIHSIDNTVEFFLNNSFLHYRSGTNWNYMSAEYHRNKTLALQSYLNKILQ